MSCECATNRDTLSDKSGGVHALSDEANMKGEVERHRVSGGMMNFMQDKESAYDSAVPTRLTPSGSAGGEKKGQA